MNKLKMEIEKRRENPIVAIVDSGINYKDPFFSEYIVGGESAVNDVESFYDTNGHGTLCAATLLKENPNVCLYIEKVLDSNNLSTLRVLEKGLTNLLDKDVSIVSMSLSLATIERENSLKKICDLLTSQGKIIICSLANEAKKSYPANFQTVWGVKGFILEDNNSFWFNKKKRIQAVVDSNPYLTRNANQSYELFGKCNSFSTAKLSGIVSKMMWEYRVNDKKSLEELAEEFAQRKEWRKDDLLESKRFPEFSPQNTYNYVLKNEVIDIISEYLKITDTKVIKEHNLFDQNVGLTYQNAFGLLESITSGLGITIQNITSVSRYDFYSVYTLVSLLERLGVT